MRRFLKYVAIVSNLTEVTHTDREKIDECRDLLSRGEWEEASRILEQVTQAGQSTLEYKVQVCAVLQAAGLKGHIKDAVQRLDL